MRKYSSTIPAMTLGAQLTAGATSITLNTGAWPTVASPDTLTLVIEPDTANEEIVYVTAHTSGSTSATILRAQESTTDITHASGSVVKHMITGADLQEAHIHMNATNYSTNGNVALHGIGTGEGAVVGTDKTQTLKNKTINVGGADNNTIGGLTVSNVSGIAGTYAPLASPNFTGTPQISGVNIATTATAPASHTHGNLTNDGKIGSSSGNVIVTGASGVLTALAAGTTSQYLRGDGTWGTPSGGTSGVSSLAGTANQISASASTGAVTLSFPTGGVTVPTGSLVATTPTTGDNTTKIATTAFVQTAVAGVGGAVYYYASAYVTSATVGSAGVISYSSENVDSSAFHSTATNTSRMTIPTGLGGKYKISALLHGTYTSANGLLTAYIRKGGTTKIDGTDGACHITSSGNTQGSFMIETIVSLAAGDYVEVYATGPTGAGCQVNSTFNIQYVGA